MRRYVLPRYRPLLFALALATVSITASTGHPHFAISANPLGAGTSCEREPSKVIGGSLLFVEVINRADEPKEARRPGWPEGYALEAALDLPEGAPFVPSSSLLIRLSPSPYLQALTLAEQRRLQSGDVTNIDVGWLNVKSFVLRIPPALAGHTFTLRARCEKSGSPRYTTNVSGPFHIVLPCDRDDTARIVACEAHLAQEAGNSSRVLAIADSMLAVGLSDAAVWKCAIPIAGILGYYEKQLAYLDRMYEDFGRTWFAGNGNLRHDRGGVPDPHDREVYEEWRARLVALINQQQQH